MTALSKAILAAVQAEPGEWSVQALADDLATRPHAVSCAIARLRAQGYEIELSPEGKGPERRTRPVRSSLARDVRRLVVNNPGKYTIPGMATRMGCSINHIRHINRDARAIGIQMIYDDVRRRGRHKFSNMVEELLDMGLTVRQIRKALLHVRSSTFIDAVLGELTAEQEAAK